MSFDVVATADIVLKPIATFLIKSVFLMEFFVSQSYINILHTDVLMSYFLVVVNCFLL